MEEVEELTSLCKLQFSEIELRLRSAASAQADQGKSKFKIKNGVTSLEAFRMRSRNRIVFSVARETASIRLTYIARYLEWITCRELSRISGDSSVQLTTRANVESALVAIREKRIRRGNRKLKTKREGLPPEVIARLHEVLDPNSAENPWRPGFNRYRNRLYIYWLLDVALRRGEALGLMLSDINFSSGTAEIIRRPDNPNDPRNDPPLVKTNERQLRVSDALLTYTEEYLQMSRAYVNNKNGYLFVASRRASR